MNDQLPTEITPAARRLTAAEFQGLAEVPLEIEWFNNISNRSTQRICKLAVGDFMQLTGIVQDSPRWRPRVREISGFILTDPAGCLSALTVPIASPRARTCRLSCRVNLSWEA